LEIEWYEICQEPQAVRIVPVYHKPDDLGLLDFLPDKLNLWPGNGRFVEDVWKNFKDVLFKGIKRYVTQNSLSKNEHLQYSTQKKNG